MVMEYQRSRCDKLFAQILTEIEPMTERMIFASGALDFYPIDELRQAVRLRLWKALHRFDASKGSKLYSYLCATVQNALFDEKKRSAVRAQNWKMIYLDAPENAHLEFASE
jgi:DNA-directed RNA polymerase specialized sigma24 family protein